MDLTDEQWKVIQPLIPQPPNGSTAGADRDGTIGRC